MEVNYSSLQTYNSDRLAERERERADREDRVYRRLTNGTELDESAATLVWSIQGSARP